MNALEDAIYDLLKVDGTLLALTGSEDRVFNGLAPIDQDMPCVIFSQAGGIEDNECPPRSVEMSYLVKGLADTAYVAGQIADAVDDLLAGSTLSVSGWVCYRQVRRGTTVHYSERDGGNRLLWHIGAIYHVWLEKS